MQVLSALFDKPPDKLKPQKTREQITQDAAKLFGEISDYLRDPRIGVEETRIARFITKVMFLHVCDGHRPAAERDVLRRHQGAPGTMGT